MPIKIRVPKTLTMQIMVAMLLGFIVGSAINYFQLNGSVESWLTGGLFYVVSKAFIASLKLLVVPLVLVSLICGTASLDDIKKLGRVGGKTMGLYLFTTAVAITLALFTALILRPGVGFNLPTDVTYSGKDAPPLIETLINIFPTNPFKSMADGEMLQIIVFAGLFGVALTLSGAPGKRILGFFKDLNEVIMKMVMMMMVLAPYGVFCLMANVFAQEGFEAIQHLAYYFITVVLVLVMHVLITYVGLLTLIGRIKPLQFFKKFKNVPMFAFSTASSGATLPITLETVEHKLGVHNSIASFTIPLGATINMDGTAIMQGVATIFISQAYGIPIGIEGLLMVVVTATLASIGTAAVPGVGLITLAMVLNQVGLPVEGIGIIMGVDRLLDMARTAVNVTGDAAVSTIVAKSEKQLDLKVFNAKN